MYIYVAVDIQHIVLDLEKFVSNSKPVKVRIAPSPTGDPHVGTGYVALFNYVFAKKYGGSFVLRIEDTDQARSKSSSEAMIMDGLKWLGLTWDEGPDIGGTSGPYRQSERKQIYQEYVGKLIDSNHAYRCFCTKERLDQMREDQKSSGARLGYDGHCKSLAKEEVQRQLGDKVPYVVRLAMPDDGKISFEDQLRGILDFDCAQIDDQVLLKSDGFPTYHLANVVDDHLMGITHVIRAEEWVSSTPKHVELYKAFGWDEPEWIHLPLLRNKDKSKISKRKNPVSLSYYMRAGYLPNALLNFLALMGWNPGNDVEVFSLKEMVDQFEYKNIHLGDPVFDKDKLNWLNQQYLQKVDDETFVSILRDEFFSSTYLKKLKPLMVERLVKFEDFFEKASFFFTGSLDYSDLKVLPKGRDSKEFKKMLKGLVELLDDVYDWDAEHLKQTLDQYREEIEWKPKDYFMPIRMVTTGRKDSPPLVETLEVLGREVVRHRLREASQLEWS